MCFGVDRTRRGQAGLKYFLSGWRSTGTMVRFERCVADVGYWLWWIVVEIIIVFLRRATNHDSVETTPFFLVAFFLSFASGKESEW